MDFFRDKYNEVVDKSNKLINKLKLKVNKDNTIYKLFERIIEDDIFALGGQLAYGLLLAIFPFLIFLLTLVGFSPVKSDSVLLALQEFLPIQAFELVKTTVVEVVETRNSNLLSLSLLFTIWSAASGFVAVIKGINKAYDEKKVRPFWKNVIISVISMFLIAFVILATFLLIVFGEIIIDFLSRKINIGKFNLALFDFSRYIILFVSMTLIFAAIYRYIPVKRRSWKRVFPGAIFCTLGWSIASLIFAFYVNNFGNYSKFYGSIGAVIVLMTWLYIISLVMILGVEINAVLEFEIEGKVKKSINKKIYKIRRKNKP